METGEVAEEDEPLEEEEGEELSILLGRRGRGLAPPPLEPLFLDLPLSWTSGKKTASFLTAYENTIGSVLG